MFNRLCVCISITGSSLHTKLYSSLRHFFDQECVSVEYEQVKKKDTITAILWRVGNTAQYLLGCTVEDVYGCVAIAYIYSPSSISHKTTVLLELFAILI